MNFWQHCALWLATDNRNNLRSLYDNHPATEEEMGAFYDFQISKIYDDEARRLAFLSWFYRFASRRRIDSAIVNSKVTPGPFGVRALEQLADGEFLDGIKNLEIEIDRLTRWIGASETVDPADGVSLCNYLYQGGATLSELGKFEDARSWLTQALGAFEKLPPSYRAMLVDLEEGAILRMVLCLQLERKYQEAVHVIDTWLNRFAFTAFPTQGRQTLAAAKAVLEDYASLVSEFSAGESTLEILADYMERIQELDSFEAARRLRREIILRFRREGAGIRIKQMGDAAINDIKRQEELIRSRFEQDVPPLIRPELSSDDEIAKLPTPQLREMVVASNKQSEESFATLERLQKSSVEVNAMCRSIRETVDRFSISQIEEIKQRVYRVPLSAHVSWLGLELGRVLVQLVVLSYIVDKVVEDLIHRGGEHLWGILKLEDRKGLLTAVMLILMLLVGKFLEKRIDKAEMKRYKAKLVRLLMERSQTMWTSYNSLVQIARSAREGLERIQLSLQDWEQEEKEDLELRSRIEALRLSMVDSNLKLRDLQSKRAIKS